MKVSNNDKGAVTKFILLLLIVIFVISVAIKFSPQIIELLKHPEDVRDYMLSINMFGKLLFFLMLVAHVFVVVFPGDILYVLGGYVFGLPLGFFLSYIGVITGGFLVFKLSRLLGYSFVKKVVPSDKLKKASKLLNSVKGMIGLFILCLIPIFPKSTLMYAAGLTPIKTSKLFFVYALSRIPVIFMWSAIGAQVYEKDYFHMIIIMIILACFAITSILLRKRIYKKSK